MNPSTMAVLRILHILAGVFWVGVAVFLVTFLVPAIRDAGPAGGQIMHQLGQIRRLPLWMMAVSLVTLLSGFGLYWIDARVGGSAWLGSGPGRTFGLGGVLGLIGAIVGMGWAAPAGRRLGALGATMASAGRPPTAEEQATMQALQRRVATGGSIAAVLLVLATMAMAVARYVA